VLQFANTATAKLGIFFLEGPNLIGWFLIDKIDNRIASDDLTAPGIRVRASPDSGVIDILWRRWMPEDWINDHGQGR